MYFEEPKKILGAKTVQVSSNETKVFNPAKYLLSVPFKTLGRLFKGPRQGFPYGGPGSLAEKRTFVVWIP